jgi:hypothetical protein
MKETENMFCPKCGHEQSLEGQRFCSGCGMALGPVASAMSPDGDPDRHGWSRKDGLKLAVFVFVAGTLALTPLAAVLDLEPVTPIFAVLGFGGAVTILTYSLLFLPKQRARLGSGSTIGGTKGIAAKVADSVKGKIGGRIHTTADSNDTVPISYAPPVGDWRDVEYAQPPSVTDSTTKLLAQEEEKKKKSDQ